MVAFRPMPILTVATLLALALLLWLGTWQLDRAQQKRALIAERAAMEAAPPFDDLQTAVCPRGVFGSDAGPGERVKPPATLLGEEVRFYGSGPEGEAGWRILRLTPAPDCTCAKTDSACSRDDLSIVEETGFESLDGVRSPPPALLEIALPPRAGVFTPQNDPERGEFYRFDAAALAHAFGVGPEQVEAVWWLAAHRPGLPAAVAEMPPSRHVGYAATWFGMAIALVAVYFVFHHRAGRLRLSS